MAIATRRLLEGPALPALLRLALPNMLVVLVQAASSTIDAFFVARLGTDVLAGVALVLPAWMLMVTMSAGGIGGGIASAVARALGGGRRADANALAVHGLIVGAALAAAFTAGLLILGESLYRALGGQGEALTAALAYSTIIFSGALAVWLLNVLASVLRGSGEMQFPALVIVLGEVLHVVLAPSLIFGLGSLPALGVRGAALSLVTSYVLRAAALAAYLLAGRSPVRIRLALGKPRFAYFADILRVGLPAAANTVLTNINVAAVTGIVGTFGTAALAGYGLGVRLEYLQIPLVFGFGTALVTLVGTNVGAGQTARARRIAWTGAGLAAAVTESIGLVVALAPSLWLGLFTTSPDVLAVGATYLRVVGPFYGLFGLGLALYFAAQGAGQLLWPLLAGIARLLVAMIGSWLAVTVLDAGLVGVFGAIAISFVVFGGAQALAITRTLHAVRSTQ
jgi:putative MATE family efflux protein